MNLKKKKCELYTFTTFPLPCLFKEDGGFVNFTLGLLTSWSEVLGEGEVWRRPRQVDLVDREGAGRCPWKKKGDRKGQGVGGVG